MQTNRLISLIQITLFATVAQLFITIFRWWINKNLFHSFIHMLCIQDRVCWNEYISSWRKGINFVAGVTGDILSWDQHNRLNVQVNCNFSESFAHLHSTSLSSSVEDVIVQYTCKHRNMSIVSKYMCTTTFNNWSCTNLIFPHYRSLDIQNHTHWVLGEMMIPW